MSRPALAESGIDGDGDLGPPRRAAAWLLPHFAQSHRAPETNQAAPGIDPVRWVPEAARLLRAGGRLVFHTTSILVALCSPVPSGPACRELLRPQRATYRLVTGEGRVQFHPGHGEWVTILRASGFTVDDLREIYAPPDAVDHPYYQLATVEWARQWPIEEIWVAHLAQ